MRRMKKTLAAALSAALLFTLCPAALAAEVTGGKEEVVYINLDPNGRVDEVEVVNIFELAQAGRIVDHGAYSAVRNMTTTDPVTLEGDTVTIDAGPGRLYYEGTLPDAAIPWDIDIRYLMDGKEVSPDALAGMSGALEIRLGIKEDPDCAGDFFAGYALQASVTLDGDRCKDIQAPGATAANVGSDKQLTYTILPGKGADISIQTQVTDFAMDPIAINGVPLSLDVQVDDEELMDQVTELLEAIEDLDQGARDIDEGTAELEDAAGGALRSGAGQLSQGAYSLQSGAGELKKGGSAVNGGAYSVNAGAEELDAGLQELNAGLGELQTGLDTLANRSGELTGGSAEVLGVLRRVQSAVDEKTLTDADLARIRDLLTQVQSRVDGLVARLDGVTGAVGTLAALQQSYEGVAASLDAAINGLDALLSGSAQPIAGGREGSSPGVAASYTAELKIVLGTLQNNNSAFAGALGPLEAMSGTAAILRAELVAVSAAAAELALHVDDLPGVLKTAQGEVDTLVERYAALDAGIRTYAQGVADAAAGCARLSAGGAALAQGSAALAAGTDQLYSGTAVLLNGIVSIYNATGALSNGAGALDSGVESLLAGVAQLRAGTGEMAEGTGQMAEQTDGMDETIRNKIDELLKSVTGGDSPVISFVSPKNTGVSAVQFVIRTPPIQKPAETAPEPTPEPDETVWERLKELF